MPPPCSVLINSFFVGRHFDPYFSLSFRKGAAMAAKIGRTDHGENYI